MKNFLIPPFATGDLTQSHELARRLEPLIGTSFKLSGKTRTDGANLRKMVAGILGQHNLPRPSNRFEIHPPKQKGIPGLLREYVDTYIVTSGRTYNLQVWNRIPTSPSVQVTTESGEDLAASDVRFVLVRVDIDRQVIRSVAVMTPRYIEEKFGRFGKPTIKHQLLVSPSKRTDLINRNPPILFYPDNPGVRDMVSTEYVQPRKGIHSAPASGETLSLDLLRTMLVPHLLGRRIETAPTKTRGQALELLVKQLLGYETAATDILAGGYPDLRHQALEVKLQDSPTVDLGQFSPQYSEPVPGCTGFATGDIRYLIALTDPASGLVQGLVLCPGSKLGDHFTYVSDQSFKCQRMIPMSFFDGIEGRSVYNP